MTWAPTLTLSGRHDADGLAHGTILVDGAPMDVWLAAGTGDDLPRAEPVYAGCDFGGDDRTALVVRQGGRILAHTSDPGEIDAILAEAGDGEFIELARGDDFDTDDDGPDILEPDSLEPESFETMSADDLMAALPRPRRLELKDKEAPPF